MVFGHKSADVRSRLQEKFGTEIAEALLKEDTVPRSKLLPKEISDKILNDFLLAGPGEELVKKIKKNAPVSTETLSSIVLYMERLMEYSFVSQTALFGMEAGILVHALEKDPGLTSDALSVLTKFCDQAFPLMALPEIDILSLFTGGNLKSKVLSGYLHLTDAIYFSYSKVGNGGTMAFVSRIGKILDEAPTFSQVNGNVSSAKVDLNGVIQMIGEIHKESNNVCPEAERPNIHEKKRGLLRD